MSSRFTSGSAVVIEDTVDRIGRQIERQIVQSDITVNQHTILHADPRCPSMMRLIEDLASDWRRLDERIGGGDRLGAAQTGNSWHP